MAKLGENLNSSSKSSSDVKEANFGNISSSNLPQVDNLDETRKKENYTSGIFHGLSVSVEIRELNDNENLSSRSISTKELNIATKYLRLIQRDFARFDHSFNDTFNMYNITFIPSTSRTMPKGSENCTSHIIADNVDGKYTTKVFINMDKLYDPQKSPEYNRAKILAEYVSVCYDLRFIDQPHHNHIHDKKIIQAFHRQLMTFLNKAAEKYSKTEPAMAEAIREIMVEKK